MQESWMERVRRRSANRDMELSKKRVVYIKSDLYPDGEFVPEPEAKISIWDRGFSLGDNAYDFSVTFKHKPFQVMEHMDRLFDSLKVVRINPGVSKEEFCELVEEVTRRNIHLLEEREEYNIPFEVTRGEMGMHGRPYTPPIPEGKGKPTVMIRNWLNEPRICAPALFTGVHVVTSHTRHVSPQCWDPKMKTYNRFHFALAMIEARLVDPNAFALMLDHDGNLAEFTGMNIFLVKDGVLMTPTDRNILRGITRANVINLAKKLDIPLVEQDLQPWHLYTCEEAFYTTSFPGPIQPIGRFNGVLIGKELPGPITKRLVKAYSDWVGVDVTGLDHLSKEERAAFEEERVKLNEERGKLAHIPY